MFINLEACLFLSELSGRARALELGGEEAQKGLHSWHAQYTLNFRHVGVLVHEGCQR